MWRSGFQSWLEEMPSAFDNSSVAVQRVDTGVDREGGRQPGTLTRVSCLKR